MSNKKFLKRCTTILAMFIVLAVLLPLNACAKEMTIVVEESEAEESANEPTIVEKSEINIITMTTKASKVWLFLVCDKDIIIDWGDGKVSNANDADRFIDITEQFVFTHDYNDEITSNIVITGNVTWFTCAGIELTALDVSRNTALTRLMCDINQLTTLDVSKNTSLETLECNHNQLTALDVSKNAALTKLECDYNQITSLDFSNNTALCLLSCVGNQLTASALNNLFITLPDYSENDYVGAIYIMDRNPLAEGNPGRLDCDTSIAQKRGWAFRTSKF